MVRRREGVHEGSFLALPPRHSTIDRAPLPRRCMQHKGTSYTSWRHPPTGADVGAWGDIIHNFAPPARILGLLWPLSIYVSELCSDRSLPVV